MSLTVCRHRPMMLTMTNPNGVSEMYAIQNAHGRYYEGEPNAYSWSQNQKFAHKWASEAEALAFKKEHKIRGTVVKLEI